MHGSPIHTMSSCILCVQDPAGRSAVMYSNNPRRESIAWSRTQLKASVSFSVSFRLAELKTEGDTFSTTQWGLGLF